MKRTIRLKGMNGAVKGQTWEASEILRIGRLGPLEVVLDDSSVSRYHAEVRATDRGWRVRDLGSTNGTRLNGVRLGNGQWPLRPRDLLQFGEVALVVDAIEELEDGSTAPPGPPATTPAAVDDTETQPSAAPGMAHAVPSAQPNAILGPGEEMRVEAATKSSWDQALEGLAFDSERSPRAGEQLLALLRAGHHLGHIEKEEDLLQSILQDAVACLDAQRGAIVLAEGLDDRLKLKALVTGRNEPRAVVSGRGDAGGRFHFSASLAHRVYGRGESILCHRADEDNELALARSIAEGAMASVLCILLRTPRKRLGILHLDRGPWQKPFSKDDLYLADALAANVSAGIESAQLLRKQRELFLDTITILAQAVEMRDSYTGGHTYRVSTYALLLAEELNMAPGDVELIRVGTPLHDIGKIGIDDAILRKPDKLTPEEFEIMKTHTVKGAEIVSTVPDLKPVIPIVRSHHERWDGKGYPDGLAGEAVSPLARVVSLADAFDAMTSDRPYRKGMASATAFHEIEKMAGKQFDPRFAAAFVAIRDKIVQDMQAQVESAPTTKRIRQTAAV